MTNPERLNPSTLAAPPANMHAHVMIAPAGARLAFIAGQVALDRDWQVAGTDLAAQAEQCFRNVRLALDALGATSEQVVQMTIIVVDYRQEMLDTINEAGRRGFDGAWPVTATTLIGAQALGHSDFLVEVNAVAAIP